jgi:copper(I)-binding protein
MTQLAYAIRQISFCAIASLIFAGCAPEPAIKIVSAVAPATPPGVSVAAVYIEIVSAEDDVLLQTVTPLAEKAEIHTTTGSNGLMQMRPVTNVPLIAHKAIRFAPGGMHLMLMNLHRPLLVDQSFPLDLHFQKAGIVTAQVQVVPQGSVAAEHR